jgi:hypothetical protein
MQASSVALPPGSTMVTQGPIVDRGVTVYLHAVREASVRQIR